MQLGGGVEIYFQNNGLYCVQHVVRMLQYKGIVCRTCFGLLDVVG